MPEVKILPPGKAYGYDRETLNKADRVSFDNARNSERWSDARRAARAASAPDLDNVNVDPRDGE